MKVEEVGKVVVEAVEKEGAEVVGKEAGENAEEVAKVDVNVEVENPVNGKAKAVVVVVLVVNAEVKEEELGLKVVGENAETGGVVVAVLAGEKAETVEGGPEREGNLVNAAGENAAEEKEKADAPPGGAGVPKGPVPIPPKRSLK